MAVVYVNDQPVDIGSEKLNLVQAALKGGVFIPHYCWHPALTVVASCRMCLVEVGERKPDGTVANRPRNPRAKARLIPGPAAEIIMFSYSSSVALYDQL